MRHCNRRNAEPGFFRRDQLAAVVRSLKISTMYVSKENALEIPFDFKTYMAKAEEVALVDSGATENFINYQTVVQLRLGSNKLAIPRPVHNVNGTPNKSGEITHSIDLYVQLGNREQRVQFFVTNLGKDHMILGHLWLRTFNPQINWTKGNLQGKLEISTTAAKQQIGQTHALLARWLTADPEKRHCTTITTLQEAKTYMYLVTQCTDISIVPTEQIRKTTIAQQMSERAYNQAKVNTEQTIPIKYQQHTKVFSETEATRFPPPRPWDHQIKLTNDAPTTINGKVYPLPTKLTEALNKWIDNMLE
jgi:gag-polyprotein putative aspartyl protease